LQEKSCNPFLVYIPPPTKAKTANLITVHTNLQRDEHMHVECKQLALCRRKKKRK